MGSEEEVVWRDAVRVVALMEYMKSGRDWSEVQFPRHAVGSYDLISRSDGSVSVSFTDRSDPNPATMLRFLPDLFPEALLKCFRSTKVGHFDLITVDSDF